METLMGQVAVKSMLVVAHRASDQKIVNLIVQGTLLNKEKFLLIY